MTGKIPHLILLLVAVALFCGAGLIAVGVGDGNYAALVAFGSAAFAGAWALPGPSP